MSRAFKENYLTKQNGCSISEVSTRSQKGQASNILTQKDKELWLFSDPLPQHCIINTSTLHQYPKIFNRIGFFCWHEYESNPELIQVSYANRPEDGWVTVGKLRLSRTAQRQYFKIKDIPVTEMKFLKINLLKNFGDRDSYLNQVQLGFVREAQAEGGRQKNFSEYIKLTSTERELKRAVQQIRSMKIEQQDLKGMVVRQNQLIEKLQENVKLLCKQNEKMHKMQELQNRQMMDLERRLPVKTSSIDPLLAQQKYQQESEEERRGRRYIQDDFLQKKTVAAKGNKSLSFHPSNKHSLHKEPPLPIQRSNKESLLRSREGLMQTDPNLSQYSESDNERSLQSEKCTELVHKLQRLLAEKVVLKVKQERRIKKSKQSQTRRV